MAKAIRRSPQGRSRSAAGAKAHAAYRRAPLSSLRVFVAVAEHQSFTRGADALGVTASAASMQVKALEDYLRLPVFRRNGRQVELTPQGQVLLPKVEQALADLERAIDEARGDRGSGPLRITMLSFFLAQWLFPRLEKFSAKHPDIEVQVHTSAQIVDFVKTAMDAGIRFGPGAWPRMHAEKVIDEWLVPVCTPALLKKHGRVAAAEDLKRYKLLHSPYEPWSAWLENKSDDVRPASGAEYDDAITIVRAAESGQGLTLARWSLAADTVQAGRLAVAGRAVQSAAAYYFICPPAHLAFDKVVSFRNWLMGESKLFTAPPGTRLESAGERS
jgi:LysR family glycine cleavage system transcriptional activator